MAMIKKDYFEAFRTILETQDVTVPENAEYTIDDLIAFCDKQIDSLNASSARAKERQAEKAKQGDELSDKVYSILSDEFMSKDEIYEALMAQYPDIDATISKVQYRLNDLARNGRVEKSDRTYTGEDGKKHSKVIYRAFGDE